MAVLCTYYFATAKRLHLGYIEHVIQQYCYYILDDCTFLCKAIHFLFIKVVCAPAEYNNYQIHIAPRVKILPSFQKHHINFLLCSFCLLLHLSYYMPALNGYQIIYAYSSKEPKMKEIVIEIGIWDHYDNLPYLFRTTFGP